MSGPAGVVGWSDVVCSAPFLHARYPVGERSCKADKDSVNALSTQTTISRVRSDIWASGQRAQSLVCGVLRARTRLRIGMRPLPEYSS